MLKNYLKIAWRSLLRFKLSNTINVLGLFTTITCCVIVFDFVLVETSFDGFHKNANRIYRIVESIASENSIASSAAVPVPLTDALLTEFSKLKVVRLFKYRYGNTLIQYHNQSFSEPNFFSADSSFFDIFTFEFIRGTAKTALAQPNSVLLTQSTSQRYFGDEEPLGKILTNLRTGQEMQVTGVIEDIPENSHLQFDALIGRNFRSTSWGLRGSWTYLLLPESMGVDYLKSRLPEIVHKYFPLDMRDKVTLSLQKLTDIHLYSHLNDELSENGDVLYLKVLPFVALALLLITCINFTNLSIAQSGRRSREIGVRKVLGGTRGQLMQQFLSEALSLSLLASILAFIFIHELLPFFSNLIGIELGIKFFNEQWLVLVLLLFVLITGVLAGSYPAFMLSGFKPVSILKGATFKSFKGFSLQRGLVLLQFSATAVFLIASLVVYEQLTFIRNKKLGIDYEQVLLLKVPWQLRDQGRTDVHVFKNALLNESNVGSVTVIDQLPWRELEYEPFRPANFPDASYQLMSILFVDDRFAEMFSVKIVHGRHLTKNLGRSSEGDIRFEFMLNQTALKQLELDVSAIGTELDFNYDGEEQFRGTVVGIVEDFHFKPLQTHIKPLVLVSNIFSVSDYGNMAIKIAGSDVLHTLERIRHHWQDFAGDWAFDISFLDNDYDALYRSEQAFGSLLRLFTFLTLLISCFGIFALSSLILDQRSKELAIRKILGASIDKLLWFVSKDFVLMALFAFLVAAPLAYKLISSWLQNFAYRISIGVETFLLAGLLTLIFAGLAVGFQSIKAAMSNPVVSLRNE